MAYAATIWDGFLINMIGIMFIVVIIINISLMISARRETKHSKKNLKQKLLMYLSMIPIILYGLAVSIYFIVGLVILITNNNKSAKIYTTLLADPCYLASGPLMLFVFTMRLDITFENTKFSYPNWVIKCFYSISLLLILSAFTIILFALLKLNTPGTLLLGIVWIISYFIFSIIIIILFVYKLNILIIATANSINSTYEYQPSSTPKNSQDIDEEKKETTLASMSSTTKTRSQSNDDMNNDVAIEHIKAVIDNELLYTMIKNSILIPIAICSSLLCLIISSIMASSEPDEQEAVYLKVNIWLSLDLTINSFCIYCLFSFNDNIYYKLCHCLQDFCQKYKLRKIKHSAMLIQVIKNSRAQRKMNQIDENDYNINNMQELQADITKFDMHSNTS